MLGPKSRLTKPQVSAAKTTTISVGGLAKKPPPAASNQQRDSSIATDKATTLTSVKSVPPTARLSQASQSSLLTAGKSTSRTSILSDTANSVCSSVNSSRKSQTTSTTTKSATPQTSAARISRSPSVSSSVRSSGTTSGGQTRKVASNGTSTLLIRSGNKTGPSSTLSAATSISSTGSSSIGMPSSSSALSASTAAARQRVPTLAMSLRDKDQQIKLLIKERDEQKFNAELMARKAEEWEEKFMQSELEKSHVTSEADDEVVELRRLAQEFEDENKKLAQQLAEREQMLSDQQFKLDEMEIDKSEFRKQLEECEEQLKNMEREQQELSAGKPVAQITTERAISKAKYEREIGELQELLMNRDESMMQLRTSLEMRKQEVANLQACAADLERKLRIETERSERHLKRIDEINLELKNSDAKLATKTEEADMQERQVKQLRQELRTCQEKLEQLSLARKKDVDVLHNKLSAARRGSTTPTSPQPFKTPTPQDEIVRLQMEIRDLRDNLTDREAELDCNRRDLEVMRRKMETRTLEVDCNNQELARRCQDLLEQNRQSEDTVKELLKSTTEHSAQLMRATEDLRESNGKCVKLREELSELELKLDEQISKSNGLERENCQLRQENEDYQEQVAALRQQVDSLNEQLGDLCQQLDEQAISLHKDRESLANQLSQNEIDLGKLRQDLNTAKQDLRTSKLQTQEAASERERLKSDLEIKEKYVRSRMEVIETLRLELEDSKRAVAEYKQKIDDLRTSTQQEINGVGKELRSQLSQLKRECQLKIDESVTLRAQWEQLQRKFDEYKSQSEEEKLRSFDEMRHKHSTEIDQLKLKLKEMEEQLEEFKSATLKRENSAPEESNKLNGSSGKKMGSQVTFSSETLDNERPSSRAGAPTIAGGELAIGRQLGGSSSSLASKPRREDYETQIEFLNSVVVDMQRKCDDYASRMSQMETLSVMSELDNLIKMNPPLPQVGGSGGSVATDSSNSSGLSSSDDTANVATLTRASAKKAADESETPTLQRNTQTRQQSVSFRSGKGQPRISGRPFCDICNVYDLHHTIYCPNVTEKLASHYRPTEAERSENNNNSNSSNNNNNYYASHRNQQHYASDDIDFEDILRQSLETITASHQFASLRRPTAAQVAGERSQSSRPYCDHCDSFGHTVRSCQSAKASS